MIKIQKQHEDGIPEVAGSKLQNIGQWTGLQDALKQVEDGLATVNPHGGFGIADLIELIRSELDGCDPSVGRLVVDAIRLGTAYRSLQIEEIEPKLLTAGRPKGTYWPEAKAMIKVYWQLKRRRKTPPKKAEVKARWLTILESEGAHFDKKKASIRFDHTWKNCKSRHDFG